MTVIININGNSNGEGFLIAPSGSKIFPFPVGLRTADGSHVDANLRIAPGGANIEFQQTNVTISPVESFALLHATTASHHRNDTILEVIVNGEVISSFNLTVITFPQIWFKGRFEVRLATRGDFYNEKRGTSKGWTFALEGEPDFVPLDSIPTSIDKPVGRVIRFNNPVALRSHVPPIGVMVRSIKGRVGSGVEEFFVGDPLIGKRVDLGPNTYFASNMPRNLNEPKPAEEYPDFTEPLALFEFHIADSFSGKSLKPEQRPIVKHYGYLTEEEEKEYGVIIDRGNIPSATFDSARKTKLLEDYRRLSPSDRINTPEGRNLAKRIGHLGGEPSEGIEKLLGTAVFGWRGKEEYIGIINDSIRFGELASPTLDYFKDTSPIHFFARMFNYHSDELCGQVHGYISVEEIKRPSITDDSNRRAIMEETRFQR
jgi:hypothetical protein